MIWLLVTVIVVCGRGEYCVCLVVKSSNFLLMAGIVLKPKINKYNINKLCGLSSNQILKK